MDTDNLRANNVAVLEAICHLSALLRPEPGKTFVNDIWVIAKTMQAEMIVKDIKEQK